MSINILIVEDYESARTDYSDAIDKFNKNTTIQIEVEFKLNAEDGLNALKNLDNPYDAVITDLKLNGVDVNEGISIIQEVKQHSRIPIFVVSGFPEDLPEYLRETSAFYQIFNREQTDNYQSVLNSILALYKTGITNIIKRKGIIENYLNEIFWKHIPYTMPYWLDKAKNGLEVERDLLRYTLSHIQEYLELGEQGILEDYHIVEFYITPPIKQHERTIFTGDVFKNLKTNIFYVVITPACDLALRNTTNPPKAEYITIVEIENFEPKPTNQKDNLKKNKVEMYHFMPSNFNFYLEGGVINFTKVSSVTLTNLLDTNNYTKVFAVSNSFKKDIIARFSNYYARQGQPNLKY